MAVRVGRTLQVEKVNMRRVNVRRLLSTIRTLFSGRGSALEKGIMSVASAGRSLNMEGFPQEKNQICTVFVGHAFTAKISSSHLREFLL